MIKDNAENLMKYSLLSKNFEKAIEFIRGTSIIDMEKGRYNIDDQRVYAFVDEYFTYFWDKGVYESHKKYIDLQYVINGTEIISVTKIDKLSIKEKYDDKRDVIFYNNDVHGEDIIFNKNEFGIFYPSDAHKPLICEREPSIVKKLVLKIQIE